jgi:hypothetical protein
MGVGCRLFGRKLLANGWQTPLIPTKNNKINKNAGSHLNVLKVNTDMDVGSTCSLSGLKLLASAVATKNIKKELTCMLV